MFRALFLGLALVIAVPQSSAAPPDATGTINLVDRAHARLNVLTFDGRDAWIACTEETIVTIDGYAAQFVQLERDQIVEIQIDPETNTALRVDAVNISASR
jgi:hypothetical protein